MKIEWNFFATSNGKIGCEGIGVRSKRRVSKTLHKTVADPILTPELFYNF